MRRETGDLHITIDQLDLIDTYKTLYPTTTAYTFFSNAYETFPRIVYMLGHIISHDRF